MNERERLICLIKQAEKEFSDTDKPVLDIEEYAADYLLANGVTVPLCSVGDTVFEIRESGRSPASGKIFDRSVTALRTPKGAAICSGSLYAKAKPYAKNDGARLGKTVFLTREEAERAIKEGEANA